jgi:hypothetical protein
VACFLIEDGDNCSRDSAVGIATGYGLDDRQVTLPSPCKVKNFRLSMSSRPAPRVHPTSYPMGTGDSFPGVKRPGRDAGHHLYLVPRSRKSGSIHPLPHTSLWRNASLVKHRDNFSFLRGRLYFFPFVCSLVNLCHFVHHRLSELRCALVSQCRNRYVPAFIRTPAVHSCAHSCSHKVRRTRVRNVDGLNRQSARTKTSRNDYRTVG